MGSTTADCLKQIFIGLDTSGPETGLAIVATERVLYEIRSGSGTNHNEALLLLLDQLLNTAGLKIEAISGIGFTIGPGMWTALRVGLSVVKGLALPRNIPVKGVNTLQALSVSACQTGEPVLAVMDARRGEVYAAVYWQDRVLIEPGALTPEKLARQVVNCKLATGFRAVGDGVELVKPALTAAGIQVVDTEIRRVSPVVVARLAIELLSRDGPDPLAEIEPIYLRRTDAEINREKRLS